VFLSHGGRRDPFDSSQAPTFHPREVVAAITFISVEHTVSFIVHVHMLCLQDGSPPQDRRQWLTEMCPRCWMGRGCEAPISWPAHPHLAFFLLIFLLWGYLKTTVYDSTVDARELWLRIQQVTCRLHTESWNICECFHADLRRVSVIWKPHPASLARW
jgi:hypothetical protein